ncbi:hypothetical protein [Kitasatospora sp. NPDC004531]
MLIKGYNHGPLVAGEPLLERAGFWPNHLLAMCRFTPDEARPEPEWFGADGADTDALSEILLDHRAWPTFRIPFQGGHSAVVVYRNLTGDPGIDYLLTHPTWPRAEPLSSFNGDWYGPGLSWRDLVHIAEAPAPTTPGIHDPAARLLLLLPLLSADHLPPQAAPLLSTALTTTGTPTDLAPTASAHLLHNRRPSPRHPSSTNSPLSGGSHPSHHSPTPWSPNLTHTQANALANALRSNRT